MELINELQISFGPVQTILTVDLDTRRVTEFKVEICSETAFRGSKRKSKTYGDFPKITPRDVSKSGRNVGDTVWIQKEPISKEIKCK